MLAEVKKLPDEPIVLVTLPKGYDLKANLSQSIPGYLRLLETFDTPVFWIVDASAVDMKVDELMIGATLVARGEHPLYHHPKIRQVIYVTSSELMKAAAAGMQDEVFGQVNIKLFDNVQDALSYARSSR